MYRIIIYNFVRKQLLDERSRFSEEIKNTNRCEKELISYRTQLDTIVKRKVNKTIYLLGTFFFDVSYTKFKFQIVYFIQNGSLQHVLLSTQKFFYTFIRFIIITKISIDYTIYFTS